MSRTSNPNDLSDRVRNRLAADRRQFEETAASELRRLGENLRAVANDELRTTEADTAVTVARVRVMLLNAWLRPLVVGVILFLGISGGTWGLMHWLAARIQSRIETLAALTVRIDEGRETLAAIEDTTWGVTLLEIDGERFVVVPDGALEDPPWTVRGQPALKLSSE